MACLFAAVYSSCNCIEGYNIPLQQLPNEDISSYPVVVQNVNEQDLGIANTPSEYVALWNADAANNAIGTLYIGVGAYCFFLKTNLVEGFPMHVLGVTPNPAGDIYVRRVSGQSTAANNILDTPTKIINATYNSDAETIELAFGVPTPGNKPVQLFHTRVGSYLTDTIIADTTSSTTFWNSIRNWLFANDLYDFSLVNISATYYQKINDFADRSYLALQYNEISGFVYHDPNDLSDSLISDSRSLVTANSYNQLNIPSGLKAVAVSTTTNLIVKIGVVATTTGMFRITNLPLDTYDIYLTNVSAIVGNPPPALALPVTNNWAYTGEGYNGISDGTPNGLLPNVVLNGSILNLTFGIKATS